MENMPGEYFISCNRSILQMLDDLLCFKGALELLLSKNNSET